GQSHPWDKYPREDLAGIFYVIRHAPKPILGVCGGQQQIALAFGARVDLIERIAPGEGYEGAFRERGFCQVYVESENESELFARPPQRLAEGQPPEKEKKVRPVFFPSPATNDVSEIQAMQHNSLPLFGVQFHPELFDAEHPHGRIILEHFLRM